MSSAASAATPPLASTCQASRVSPLENSRLVRALYAAPTRPSSVEVTKKAPSAPNHQAPPPTTMTARRDGRRARRWRPTSRRRGRRARARAHTNTVAKKPRLASKARGEAARNAVADAALSGRSGRDHAAHVRRPLSIVQAFVEAQRRKHSGDVLAARLRTELLQAIAHAEVQVGGRGQIDRNDRQVGQRAGVVAAASSDEQQQRERESQRATRRCA